MKQKNDYLETCTWYKQVITDPYDVVMEFFHCDGINSYRKTIRNVLFAANSKRIYRKDQPGELLFVFKMFESLITAAYYINQGEKKTLLTVDPANMLDRKFYFGRKKDLMEWEYFPRTLSTKEYFNPYLVFKNFCKFQTLEKWKYDLNEILYYSLLKDSFLNSQEEIDTISIYFHLTKLIEASHLIHVRGPQNDNSL